MARLRYNNQSGTLGAALSNSGTTITFNVAPDFATLTGSDYIPLALDGVTTSYEIVYLVAYTAGSLTGTITREAEDYVRWPAVSHGMTDTWTMAPTVDDYIFNTVLGTITGGTIYVGTGNTFAYTLSSGSNTLTIGETTPGTPITFSLFLTQPYAGAPGTLSSPPWTWLGSSALQTTNNVTDEVVVTSQDGSNFFAYLANSTTSTYNVKSYGARGDYRSAADASVTASSTTMTFTGSSQFNAQDAGRTVTIAGGATGRTVTDGAMTATSTTITSATAAFVSGDVGKTVSIVGAGVAGATLVTTLSYVSNGTTATVATAASTTVTGASVTLSGTFTTTIASVTNSTTAVLNAAPGTTVTNAVWTLATDDTTAIQSALTAAVSAGGGQVVFPTGQYRISTGLTVGNNVEVVGYGTGNTAIYPFGTAAGFVGTYSVGSPLTNFTLRDLTIDGANQQGTYATSIKGVFLVYQSACTYENLVIQNTIATGLGIDYLTNGTTIHACRVIKCGRGNQAGTSGGGGNGIGIATGQSTINEFEVSDCFAYGNGRRGIMIESQTGTTSTGMVFSNCVSEANLEMGFDDSGGSGAIWTGCRAINNVDDGFSIDNGTVGATAVPGDNGVYTGCIASGNRYGFSYQPTAGTNAGAGRITFVGCKASSNSLGWQINPISGNGVTGIELNACEAYSNTGSGIKTLGGSVTDLRINGCRFNANGQTSGSSHFGIEIASTVTNMDLTDNRCYDSGGVQKQTYGISLATGFTLTNVNISDNNLRGNLTGGLTTAATLAGNLVFRNNISYNPVGSSVPGTAFAIGATTVAATNNTGVDGTVYCTVAGTVTAVSVNGVAVSGTIGTQDSWPLKAGGTITFTYTVAPTLVFVGD